jgi:hypothetical protein
MTKVTVDESLRARLHGLTEPLELCDGSGQVIARVVPVLDLSAYEPWEPEVGEEELQRRERSDKWYITKEVLAHLRNLDK